MLGQPAVTSEEQAMDVLTKWLGQQGYKDEIKLSYSYGRKHDTNRGQDFFDFDVIKPYGGFYVFEDGTIRATYGLYQDD